MCGREVQECGRVGGERVALRAAVPGVWLPPSGLLAHSRRPQRACRQGESDSESVWARLTGALGRRLQRTAVAGRQEASWCVRVSMASICV